MHLGQKLYKLHINTWASREINNKHPNNIVHNAQAHLCNTMQSKQLGIGLIAKVGLLVSSLYCSLALFEANTSSLMTIEDCHRQTDPHSCTRHCNHQCPH